MVKTLDCRTGQTTGSHSRKRHNTTGDERKMGLLRRIQDARLYEAAYTAGEEVGYLEGYLPEWKAGNDEGRAEKGAA